MPFPFEKLVVYQKAEEWADMANAFVVRAKSQPIYGINDQLARSSTSIPLNISEGLGKWSAAERRKYFHAARGSVFECVPIIRFLHRRNIISLAEYHSAYAILEEVGKILTTLITKDRRTPPPHAPIRTSS